MNTEDKAAIEALEEAVKNNWCMSASGWQKRIYAVIAIAKRATEDEPPKITLNFVACSKCGVTTWPNDVHECKPEQWPKWYVLDEKIENSDRIPLWAIERLTTSLSIRHGVREDGTIEQTNQSFPKLKPESWLEVTEAEAMARVTPTPVESPDDWIEFDRKMVDKPRFKIDQVSDGNGSNEWSDCILNWDASSWSREISWKMRCRRKDLPKPVESPDDWVTQDRVPARPGIDERRYSKKGSLLGTEWCDCACINWDRPAIHGAQINGDTLEIRCRRKDLPKPPEDWVETLLNPDTFTSDWGPFEPRNRYMRKDNPELQKTKRVELWCRSEGGGKTEKLYVFASIEPPIGAGHKYQKIHSDGNGGWYLEVPQ